MQQAASDDDLSATSIVTSRVALTRLSVGLLQGLALYFLYLAHDKTMWPATNGYFFGPLVLICLFAPVLIVSSLGHLGRRRLWIWVLAAAAIAAVLGLHDIWRHAYPEAGLHMQARKSANLPSPLIVFFAAVGFYIAHALVLASAADKRRIARYPTYFETAWKLAIQLKFSALFIGVLWLILYLGSSLFMLVKLDFLRKLLEQPWFVIPVLTFSFNTALHITDVRPSLVRGIRTLLLVLMSWLLPVTVLIVAGFLIMLPFTGLEPLWATRHATAVLLGSSAVLVVLINAAFQGGEQETKVARVLRISTRIASVLLLPMLFIAIYSLGLRVAQYGWTGDRVIAAACILVSACYAVGYGWAALDRGEWLRRIAPTNIVTAFVVLTVLLGIFTPVADPARVAVSSQLARLEAGKTAVAKFDFDYLRFQGARYGHEALLYLKAEAKGADAPTIKARADTALKTEDRWSHRKGHQPVAIPDDVAANITMMTKSRVMPESFVKQNWKDSKNDYFAPPQCLTLRDIKCEAYLIDFNGDGKPEILLRPVAGGPALVFAQERSGEWVNSGVVSAPARCKLLWELLARGDYRAAPPVYSDLEVDGQRLYVEPARGRHYQC